MTQRGTYILTAVAAGLYLFLSWAFADGLFSFSNFWNSDEVSSSSLFTYLMVIAIVLAGYQIARNIPAEEAQQDVRRDVDPGQIPDPALWRKLLGNVHWALIWLPVRFFVGREWLGAGEHKIRDSAWMDGGTALQGYWERAVAFPSRVARRSRTVGTAISCSTCSITSGTHGSDH
jgi:hypothetical protein